MGWPGGLPIQKNMRNFVLHALHEFLHVALNREASRPTKWGVQGVRKYFLLPARAELRRLALESNSGCIRGLTVGSRLDQTIGTHSGPI